MLATSVLEFLGGLSTGKLFILGAALFASVATVAYYWYRAQASGHRARTTAQMLQRGFTAEQIESVLRAQAEADADESDDGPVPADPEVRLVKFLSDNSYDGNDVDRIMRAVRARGAIDLKTVEMVEALAKNWTEADDIERILQSSGREEAVAMAK